MAGRRQFHPSKSCSSIPPAVAVRKISSEYQSERVMVVDSNELVKKVVFTPW